MSKCLFFQVFHHITAEVFPDWFPLIKKYWSPQKSVSSPTSGCPSVSSLLPKLRFALLVAAVTQWHLAVLDLILCLFLNRGMDRLVWQMWREWWRVFEEASRFLSVCWLGWFLAAIIQSTLPHLSFSLSYLSSNFRSSSQTPAPLFDKYWICQS